MAYLMKHFGDTEPSKAHGALDDTSALTLLCTRIKFKKKDWKLLRTMADLEDLKPYALCLSARSLALPSS